MIRRTLSRVAPGCCTTTRLTATGVIAVAGKTWRGARDAAGHLTTLLTALLGPMDLTDVVVTADALHSTLLKRRHYVETDTGVDVDSQEQSPLA